jgi:hypothetical protein
MAGIVDAARAKFTTTLKDNATIEAQIVGLQGDAVFHKNITIYESAESDPPERKLEVAINNLRAGSPRIAERMLVELLHSGRATAQAAYYAGLAILSNRAVTELGEAELGAFRDALRVAHEHAQDGWEAHLRGMDRILSVAQTVTKLSAGTKPDDHEASIDDHARRIDGELAALPADRRADVYRHLSQILEDVESDRVAHNRLGFADTARTAEHRRDRAWRFFEAEPHPPMRPVRQSDRVSSVRAGLAVGIGCIAAVSVGAGLLDKDGASALLPLFLALAGIVGGGYCLRIVLGVKETRDSFEKRLKAEPSPGLGSGHGTPFHLAIARLVLTRFADVAPNSENSWNHDTAGLRWWVIQDFYLTYKDANIPAVSVNWLIRSRIDQIAKTWQDRELFKFRTELKADSMYVVGLIGGLVVMMVSFVVGDSMGVRATDLLAAFAFFGMIAAFGYAKIGSIGQMKRADQADAERQLVSDSQFFEHWRSALRHAPEDTQIGDWLAADLTWINALGMQRFGLTRKDVLASLVLTEGTPQSTRTRVLHGIPRYSAYTVHHMFFTDNGVREFIVDLDMFTGTIHKERRTSFRYDALAAARLFEHGDRRLGRGRVILNPEVSGPGADDMRALMRNQVLSVSLVSGHTNDVVVENFNDLTDENLEDMRRLKELALDTSGVREALRVLESVAGEGRDWAANERRRLRQARIEAGDLAAH